MHWCRISSPQGISKKVTRTPSDYLWRVLWRWRKYIDPAVRDKVIFCNKSLQNKEKKKASKKKRELRKLAAEVRKFNHQQALDSNFSLTNKSPGKLIAWKRQKNQWRDKFEQALLSRTPLHRSCTPPATTFCQVSRHESDALLHWSLWGGQLPAGHPALKFTHLLVLTAQLAPT